MKQCAKCTEPKQESEFPKRGVALRAQCKMCYYTDKNARRRKQSKQERIERIRVAINSIKVLILN